MTRDSWSIPLPATEMATLTHRQIMFHQTRMDEGDATERAEHEAAIEEYGRWAKFFARAAAVNPGYVFSLDYEDVEYFGL